MIIRGDARKLELSQFNPPYGVIVADCPWDYYLKGQDGVGSQPQDIYNGQMSIDEICDMPVKELSDRNGVLYLWGVWPKVPECLQVMSAWGYSFVSGFPWIKMTSSFVFQPVGGYWVLGVSEYVLIGKKGNAHPPEPADRYLGIISPSLKHSKKPESIHDMAETLPGPYLELFARRERKGWDCFGNQFEEDSDKIKNRLF